MTGEQIQTEMQAYFETLSYHAPRTTVNSHRDSIRPFVSFCHDRGISFEGLAVTHVQTFLTPQLASHSIQTIKGHIDSLANFLAYLWICDPAIVKTQIYHSQNRSSAKDDRIWTDLPVDASPCLTPNDPRIASVEMLVDYLRQRRYGSRAHVFVELLTATMGQFSVIQQVDVDNLNLNESTAMIRIPQTHAVSAYGLLEERTAPLPSRTIDALELYLDQERVAVKKDDYSPLFTTPSGRVDPSTIRRSIKQASRTSLTTPIVQHETDDRVENKLRDEKPSQITPSDIWRYSLRRCIDH